MREELGRGIVGRYRKEIKGTGEKVDLHRAM